MGHKSGFFHATNKTRTSTFEGNLKCNGTLYAYGAPMGSILGGKDVHVYFVDEENGNDGNNGLTWATAFATLEKCWGNTTGNKVARDNYDDDAAYYVFVAPGTYAPTLPLRVYGHGIHIIGMGTPGSDSGVNITDTGTGPFTYGLIYWGAANSSIENIQFNMTTDVVGLNLMAADNCVIANCNFNSVASACTKAIQIQNIRSTEIAYNGFGIAGGCFKYPFYSTTGADQYLIDSWIHDNRIYSNVSSAVGILVDSQLVSYGTVIDKNWINLADAAGTPIGIDWNPTNTPLITRNFVTVPTSKTAIESAASPTGILHNATQAGSVETDPNTANG